MGLLGFTKTFAVATAAGGWLIRVTLLSLVGPKIHLVLVLALFPLEDRGQSRRITTDARVEFSICPLERNDCFV